MSHTRPNNAPAKVVDKPVPGKPVSRERRWRTQQETWEKIVDSYGDPLEELADIAFDKMLDVRTRKDALKEIIQYGHAKRRSMEITGADGNPLEVRLKLIDQISNSIAQLTANKDD